MNRTCVEHGRLRVKVFGKTIARGEAGFTMVEVLVALAILAITVTPLMGLFTMAPMLHAQREQQLRAAFLAQLRLEEVKNKIIHNFEFQYPGDGYNKSDGAAADFPTDEGFELSDANYRYTITDNHITKIIGGGEGGGGAPGVEVFVMRDITIRVWYDKNGNDAYDTDEQDFEVITKVARRRI